MLTYLLIDSTTKNGMLPITLPQSDIDQLLPHAKSKSEFTVDLVSQKITVNDLVIPFEINAFRKECLVGGLDDIALTLQHEKEIIEFEEKRSIAYPWLDGVGYVKENVQNLISDNKKIDW